MQDEIEHFYLDLETAIVENEQGGKTFEVSCAVIMSSTLAHNEETDEFFYPSWCFLGEEALQELCNFLFYDEDSLLERKREIRVWAHNGGPFDWYPILGEFCKRVSSYSPNVIMSGSTIKQIKIGSHFFGHQDVRQHIS